jgi:hypothetical protein
MNFNYTENEERTVEQFHNTIKSIVFKLYEKYTAVLDPLVNWDKLIPSEYPELRIAVGNLLSEINNKEIMVYMLQIATCYKEELSSSMVEVLREFKDKVMHRLEVMNVAPSESARHIGGLEDERDKASALILYYKRCDTLLASLPVVLNFINGLLQTLKNIEYRYNKCVQLKNDKDLSPEVMDFVEATERFYNLEIGGSGHVHGFITDIREDVNKIYEYLLSISNVTYITRPVYRRRAEEILRDINSDTSVSQQGGVLGDEGDTTMEESGSFDGFVLGIFGDDIVDGEENANMINLGDTINDNFLAAMAEEAALEQGDDILDDQVMPVLTMWDLEVTPPPLTLADLEPSFNDDSSAGHTSGDSGIYNDSSFLSDIPSIGTDTLAWMSPETSMDSDTEP